MPIDRKDLGDDVEGDRVLRRQYIKVLKERINKLQEKLNFHKLELQKYKDELLELENIDG